MVRFVNEPERPVKQVFVHQPGEYLHAGKREQKNERIKKH